MLKEFREFAVKGSVIDMGVGIVIGAAFTGIVSSFVADVLNPLIGLFTNGIDFSGLYINLSDKEFASLKEAKDAGAATINYGLFINAIISFVIVAFVLFLLIRAVNRMKQEEAKAPAEPPAPPREQVLLEEIRDLLAKNDNSKT